MVLGVENDHAALLHVGIDPGQRRLGEPPRIGEHRPVEDRKEGDLVGEDVDGVRITRLHGGFRDQERVEADQALAARRVGGGIAGEHVTEGDLGRGLDGAAVVDARAARWGWRRRLCERGAGQEQGPRDNESGNGRGPGTLRASAEEEDSALDRYAANKCDEPTPPHLTTPSRPTGPGYHFSLEALRPLLRRKGPACPSPARGQARKAEDLVRDRPLYPLACLVLDGTKHTRRRRHHVDQSTRDARQ